MKYIVKLLDFWLGDFKWYRDLTETQNLEWICKHEKNAYGGINSTWGRYPKGTYIMYTLAQKLSDENPNFKTLDAKTQRQKVQEYIDMEYGAN